MGLRYHGSDRWGDPKNLAPSKDLQRRSIVAEIAIHRGVVRSDVPAERPARPSETRVNTQGHLCPAVAFLGRELVVPAPHVEIRNGRHVGRRRRDPISSPAIIRVDIECATLHLARAVAVARADPRAKRARVLLRSIDVGARPVRRRCQGRRARLTGAVAHAAAAFPVDAESAQALARSRAGKSIRVLARAGSVALVSALVAR